MNVRNLGQGNKSWVWLCIATWKPQACGSRSQKLWDMKTPKTHTNNVHPIPSHHVRIVPMLKGMGVILPSLGLSSCLGMLPWICFHTPSLKDQLVSVWTMMGTNCYHRIPAGKGRYSTGSTKSISLSLTVIHTHTQTHANHLPCPKQTPTQVLPTG